MRSADRQWRDTGLTPVQVILHKGRGMMEVCISLSHLYSKAGSLLVMLLCVGGVGGTLYYVDRAKANIALAGSELDSANYAYSSIRSADELAEDFLPGAGRETAMHQAEMALSKMHDGMRSKKGRQAARIFTYYLNAVQQLPLQDLQCAAAMMAADKGEAQFEDALISNDDRVIQDVAYFHCRDQRSKLLRVIASCQAESFTLVTGTNPPPVSLCAYRHDLPDSSR